MPQLLVGKTALVLGIANKWSIAYAIAAAMVREGATLVITYQGERQRQTVEDLGAELKAAKVINCDVTRQDELERLMAEVQAVAPRLDAVVHSIAFANKDDLSRPFLETSRDGYLLAQEVSAYSLVSVAGELGASKIRVNAISAGPIKTASARGIKDFSKILDSFSAVAPLRRNTEPAEVADTAVFLASDLGRGVTGNVVFVDAGFQIVGLGVES